MASLRAPRIDPKVLTVAVAIAAAVVIGLYAAVVLAPSASSSSTAVAGVFSHTGVVADAAVTTPPAVSVAAGGTVFLFVGFVNERIGGGAVSAVSDSLGDSYQLLATTGLAQNHTAELFESEPIAAHATLSASVTFIEGDTPQGGAVALVDVTGMAVDDASVYNASGPTGPTASLVVPTVPHSLVLFFVSGQMKDTPFTPGAGETLLDTSNATSGPFGDGEGFATYAATATGTVIALTATLAHSAVWNAIAVVLPPAAGT